MTKLKRRMRILALFSTIIAACIMATSCPNGSTVLQSTTSPLDLEQDQTVRMITVTVTAGPNITVKSPGSFKAEDNSAWATVKTKAQALVEANSGYRIKAQWKRGSTGPVLNDSDVFTENVIVYAESEALPEASKLVKITVKADTHITLLNTRHIDAIKQGETNASKWSDIKAEAEAKLKFDDGWELHSWREGAVSGPTVLNDDTFASDTEVFAVAKQKTGTGGGTPPTPPPSANEKYNVTFSVLQGGSLTSGLAGISIKAKNLSNSQEYTNGFVADKGNKIEFTVTLSADTQVEEWKLNGNSVDYGSATFTVPVDGTVNVTALIEKCQFMHQPYDHARYRIYDYTSSEQPPRVTANGTLVFPSKIGPQTVQVLKSDITYNYIRNLCKFQSIKHVWLADGIEELSMAELFLDGSVGEISKLQSVRLPNTLTTIGASTLRLPWQVRYLVIPKSVKRIENTLQKMWNGYVGISVYFEHEAADVATLTLDTNWCSGSFPAGSGIRIFVKNEQMKDKLKNVACKNNYSIRNALYTTVPAAGDDEW